MAQRRTLRASLVRLILAYLLVVQAVLGGAVTGLHAAPSLAAGADVLCTGGASGPFTPDTHDALCCVIGCAGALQPSVAPGGAAFAPLTPRIQAVRFESAARAAALRLRLSAFDATGPPARA